MNADESTSQVHADSDEKFSALGLSVPNLEGAKDGSLEDFMRALAPAARIDVKGLRGPAFAFVCAHLARKTKLVVVVGDSDRARALQNDIEFFLSLGPLVRTERDTDVTHRRRVESLLAPDHAPFTEVAHDRRALFMRLDTLTQLASNAVDVLIVGASALVRKTIPRAQVQASKMDLQVGQSVERAKLLERMIDFGYQRAPIVEDPGTFAVRGSLLDVWAPTSEQPVRIDFFDDEIVSIRAFDVDGQRTTTALARIELSLATDLDRSPMATERARTKLTELCDAIDYPSTKARQLIEDVLGGRTFFGTEAWLPAFYEHLESVIEYLPASALWLWDDPGAIARSIDDELAKANHAREHSGSKRPLFSVDDHYLSPQLLWEQVKAHACVVSHRLAIAGAHEGTLAELIEPSGDCIELASTDNGDLIRAIAQARMRGKYSALSPLVAWITRCREQGFSVLLTARSASQSERLANLLSPHLRVVQRALSSVGSAWSNGSPESATITVGSLASGGAIVAARSVFVTEEDIFGTRAHTTPQKTAKRDSAHMFLEDLRSLSVGDLVVHSEHGIGRYLGLEHRDLLGPLTIDPDGRSHQTKTRVDLIIVEYSGGDRLFLPVYRLNQVQKYTGGEVDRQKLDRLGGLTFGKTKSKVAHSVRQMADELLRLYAERIAREVDPMPIRSTEYSEFEATFPFEETPDQSKAIGDVHGDLEKTTPMDRLVCGDVGFGKTEVALRAAFRMAMSGKQVAILCPTTVLAQQHFNTFVQRFSGHPILVGCLSRFSSKKEQSETLAKLRGGTLDVVVGTHRLLSKDVHWRNLGLLIVDEEQRFGVTHKERIKHLSKGVHVLTLSATPIPRTLQMAVSGLRDLSLITTPPVDRRAIRTMVTRYDDHVLRDAITRELARGGQVFYVYNRVGAGESGGLYERANKLQQLVPSAKVAVAHGQMNEKDLEQVMIDFVDGRYDVLCATAIIESGLDIPRANTIIIDRADLLGLAQLYQLRGRVGRSKERAYCYLLVPSANEMTDEARTRIEAIEQHSDLGSGFKIASLDLELRGAGDLLGAEQSGSVAQVGFDMYCRMLEQAVAEIRGEPPRDPEVDPELSFDVEALLPDDYIDDVGVRLSFYKRLSEAIDEDAVTDLARELEDRFGELPDVARAFVSLMRIKCELRELRALGCEATKTRVSLHLRQDAPLAADKVAAIVAKKKSPWRLSNDFRLTRRYDPEQHQDAIEATNFFLSELATMRA